MSSTRLRAALAVAAIMACAAAFWLYQIRSQPRGMHWDENIQVIEALRILRGGYLPLYPAAPFRQFRFRYLAALAIALFGRTPGAVRLMNVTVGLATIPGIYLAIRPVYGRRVALLSALGFATTLWPILMYRVYVAARTLPPFYLAYFAWQAALAWQAGRRSHWLLGGAILGAAMYSYYSILVFPLALGGWALYLAICGKLRRLWPGAAYGALSFGLVAGFQALTLVKFAGQSVDRPAVLTVIHLGMPPGQMASVLWSQTYQALRMFIFTGDWDPVNNAWLPGSLPPPVFPIAMAIPFVIGHLVMLRRWRSGWTAFYYIWAAVALLPTILSTNVPSYGRASMLLTVLFIWPALGLNWLREQLARRLSPILGLVLPAGLIGLGAMSTGSVIFLDNWYAQPWKNVHHYDTQWADMAIEINRFLEQGWTGDNLIARRRQAPENRLVIVEQGLWRLGLTDSVVEYLVGSDHPSLRIVPHQRVEVAPTQTVLLFWPANGDGDPLAYLPEGRRISVHAGGWDWDVSGQQRLGPLYAAYLAAPPDLDSARGPMACWREILCLWDAAVRVDTGGLEVEMAWQAPPTDDFDPAAHLALWSGDRIVAQVQGSIAPEYLPLANWRSGDYVTATLWLPTSAPADPTQDRLTLTLYTSATANAPLPPDGETAATAAIQLPWPYLSAP